MDQNKKMDCRAEIIAIGDELTSGQRLDTNSRWLSRKLNELGVTVAFHTTVGDNLEDNVAAFHTAISRVDLIVCTGGLGPTADDLTRQVLAEVSGQELKLDEVSMLHIENLFKKRGRAMPDNNRVQAYFPNGATVIANPLGSAPGIQMTLQKEKANCLLFALPGVPAELRDMWKSHVIPSIKSTFQIRNQIFHHTVHCFGKSESEIESLVPDLISRTREPLVGITASQATISLRIQAHSVDEKSFQDQIQPTIDLIRQKLGDLIFGENGTELQQVVINQLVQGNKTIAVVDMGHHGLVANWLSNVDETGHVFRGGATRMSLLETNEVDSENPYPDLVMMAMNARNTFGSDIGIAYQVFHDRSTQEAGDFKVQLACIDGTQSHFTQVDSGGHPSIRESRIGKWVVNEIRLWLNKTRLEISQQG